MPMRRFWTRCSSWKAICCSANAAMASAMSRTWTSEKASPPRSTGAVVATAVCPIPVSRWKASNARSITHRLYTVSL